MFCSNCGEQIANIARYCPECGSEQKTRAGISTVSADALNKAKSAMPDLRAIVSKAMKNLSLVEAVLFVALAPIVLLAPLVEIDLYFGKFSFSVLSITVNSSRYSNYLGGYFGWLLMLGMLTIGAALGACMNAKISYCGTVPKERLVAGKIRVANVKASCITGYAIIMIISLIVLSSETRGVVGPSGWAWLLLALGIACQVLDHKRRAAIAQ